VSRKITVLVVDDEIHMRRLIGRMLQSAGFNVIETASGSEALRLLNESGRRPDLVTCDISMPDMDGFEILKAIRSNPDLVNLPVIMLTAMGQLSDADRAKEMGATDYITKPFSAISLINIVRRQTTQTA
jgi:CheY-like chemotaxis protein